MANFLVTYDLRAPGKDYTRLIQHLQTYPTCWSFQKSAWIVGPATNSYAVAEAAWAFMDPNDKLFVQQMHDDRSWAGYDQKETEFLRMA